MPAATLDLTGDRIIEQNSIWQMDLLYPGDVTGSFLRGQIRENYGGKVLAQFQTNPPDYLVDLDKTRFTLLLFPNTTAKLPVPAGGGSWVYDCLLQLPGEPARRLLQGRVYVSPGVTGNG